jgi:hypothetical protein
VKVHQEVTETNDEAKEHEILEGVQNILQVLQTGVIIWEEYQVVLDHERAWAFEASKVGFLNEGQPKEMVALEQLMTAALEIVAGHGLLQVTYAE